MLAQLNSRMGAPSDCKSRLASRQQGHTQNYIYKTRLASRQQGHTYTNLSLLASRQQGHTIKPHRIYLPKPSQSDGNFDELNLVH